MPLLTELVVDEVDRNAINISLLTELVVDEGDCNAIDISLLTELGSLRPRGYRHCAPNGATEL